MANQTLSFAAFLTSFRAEELKREGTKVITDEQVAQAYDAGKTIDEILDAEDLSILMTAMSVGATPEEVLEAVKASHESEDQNI